MRFSITAHRFTAALVGLSLFAGLPAPAMAQIPVPDLVGVVPQVVDGDTLKIAGQRLRFVGIDAPETYKPRCDHELEKGKEATARLKSMMRDADDVEFVDTGDIDKYDRPLIHLKLDGRDAGQMLMEEGLALEWKPGRQAWLERRRHWCGF